jgi:hypothetical protein
MMTMTKSEIDALKWQYALHEQQCKKWNASCLNPLFDGKRDNFGFAKDAAPGYALVELTADDCLVFYPIRAWLCTSKDETVGAIAMSASIRCTNR